MKPKNLFIAIISISLAMSSMLICSCSKLTRTQKGAAIGVSAGGTLGALIGKKAGNTAIGAIIGSAIGGTAGAFIGHTMERQAEEISKSVPNARVIQAGEGLIVQFDSAILFNSEKSTLRNSAKVNIQNLCNSIKNYPKTNILVIGHTDSLGYDAYNIALSERRAQAVKNYVVEQGIDASRIKIIGKGASEPIADNSTEVGRAKNRRVEIVIVANNELKETAKAPN